MRLPSLLDFLCSSFVVLQLALFLEHSGVVALSSSAFRRWQQYADNGLLPDGTPWLREITADDFDMPEFFSRVFQADNETASVNATSATEVIREEFVTLPIDHFGDFPGTYQNRFWVAEADYKPGGPVFIYDVGEANGSAQAIVRLQNETSFFKQLVKRFGGIGIVWEHRFYGSSSPYNVSLDTSANNFKYLTSEQALADVPTFAWQFKRKNLRDFDLTPASTPWVFVGGSYPGMRAAFIRKFYPGTIFASWASSAPVQASTDMSFYFEPMYKGLVKAGFGNCTKDIKAAIVAMDEIMDRNDPKEYGAMFEKFLGKGAANNTRAGFADALTTVYALFQSYGIDGVSYNMRGFCDFISRDPVANKSAPAEGWAPTKGANYTIDRWAKWPYFAYVVNDNMWTHCDGPFPEITALLSSANISVNETKLGTNTTKITGTSVNLTATVPNCNLQERFPDPASISWTWQYCTQWGFFQSINYGDHQLVSKYNSLAHQQEICFRQFPDGQTTGLLPDWPREKETNRVFGGWNIRPTNVFWTGGQFDPWRTLSPLSEEEQSPQYKYNQTVPRCGGRKYEDYPDLFSYLVPDSEHAFDFRSGYNASVPARGVWDDALTQWLRCFKKWSPFDASGDLTPAVGGPAQAPTRSSDVVLDDPVPGEEMFANVRAPLQVSDSEEGQMEIELAQVRRSLAKVQAAGPAQRAPVIAPQAEVKREVRVRERTVPGRRLRERKVRKTVPWPRV